MSIEWTREEVLALRDRLSATEHNVYANVGPSPILVSLREAMQMVDRWLEKEET